MTATVMDHPFWSEQKWRVRNTFVEVMADDCGSPLCSPRVPSDPGTSCEDDFWSDPGRTWHAKSALVLGSEAARWEAPPDPPEPPAPFGVEVAAAAAAAPSIGSLGHPIMCTLLCKHLQEGRRCPLGERCGFCHHPGCRLRARQLDKTNREVFRRLGAQDKIDAMWTILQEKVGELGLGARAALALEEWRSDVERASPQPKGVPAAKQPSDRQARRIVNVLKHMSITDLSGLPCPQEPFLQKATARLLRDLRQFASPLRPVVGGSPCSTCAF